MKSCLVTIAFILMGLKALALARSEANRSMPRFDRQNENVTAVIGSNAVIPCYVNNLGDHKVAWLKAEDNDILAMGDIITTNDERIKLLHGYASDWSLSIQPINEDDHGEYICQVNTEPPIISRINLQVLLPPKIIEERSSIVPAPVLVGETLKLYCHAEGTPTPQVSWYFRQHEKSIEKRNHHRMRHIRNSPMHQIYEDGSTLIIRNISVKYSGIFECIANNSVLPAASRKIKVNVEFAPEVEMQNTEVEQRSGLDVRLECRIKANPLINHYWMKNDEVIDNTLINMQGHQANFIKDLTNQDKYEINIYNQNNEEFLTISSLVIKNLQKSDFGKYQCFAVNAHNTTKGVVELKELKLEENFPTTKVAASRILFYNNDNNKNNNQDYLMTTRTTEQIKLEYTKKLQLKDEDDTIFFGLNGSETKHISLATIVMFISSIEILKLFVR